VLVAGTTATQPRTADIAAPLQPTGDQARRSGLGVSRALALQHSGLAGYGMRTPPLHGFRIYNAQKTESAAQSPECAVLKQQLEAPRLHHGEPPRFVDRALLEHQT
jgi:hypothetical protein